MNRKALEKILLEDNVVVSINNNLNVLLSIVPEIQNMIGFDHKHPHHHLDVWKHTLLALSLSPNDLKVRIVLLLHDIGKPFSYQEGNIRHFKGHPLVSSKISKDILTRLNYNEEEIKAICDLIKEHDNLITNSEIEANKEFCQTKFKIQFCDALAHNPLKLEKRINYLMDINEKLNTGEEKHKYTQTLLEFKKNVTENENKRR